MSFLNLGWLADLTSNVPFEDGLARAQRRAWDFIGFSLVDDPNDEVLRITVTGADDLEVEFLKVTTMTITSPTNEVLTYDTGDGGLLAHTFRVAANAALYIGDNSGATGVTIPTSRTGFRLGWQGSDATPGDLSVEGQNAAASSGNQGGDVIVRTGAGDTGQVGGDMLLDVNEDDGTNVSAELRIAAGGQRLVTIAERAASTAQLDFGTNGAPILGKVRGSALAFEATGALGVGTTVPEAAKITTSWGAAPQSKIEGYAEAATTNATPASVTIFTPDNDRTVHVEARILGTIKGATTTCASYTRHGTFRKTGGVVTKVAVTAVHTGEDVAGWDVDLGDGGGSADIVATVTGAAATKITWKIYWTIYLGSA